MPFEVLDREEQNERLNFLWHQCSVKAGAAMLINQSFEKLH